MAVPWCVVQLIKLTSFHQVCQFSDHATVHRWISDSKNYVGAVGAITIVELLL